MAARIRILELIRDFGVEGGGGGASRFCVELSQRLDPARFEVSVCGLWDTGTPFEQERIARLTERGIHAFAAARWDESSPYGSFVRANRSLRAALRAQPVSILHSHSEFADMAALLLKTLPNRPAIVRTVHNGFRLEWKNRPLRRWLFSYFLYPLNFDLEIGVSQSIVDNLDRRLLARRIGKTALLVPNAINLARFAGTQPDPREVKRSLGIPQDAFVVGAVGRLAEEKNYACLIQAAAVMLQRMPGVYFVIVGEGKLADALKRLAARLNIAPHIIFTGPRSDVERLYAGMDLFVSSSLWEGTSTTILESMAAGVPVVATDIPGTRPLVCHLTNGWLVPPADSTALARAIVEAFSSPMQRAEFARRARETAQVYSIAKIAAEYRAIYSAAAQRMV